ncbi:uncharacterized protein Dana_GF16925 [Drosophila ananassae]|uniref:PH domain-containing protein n=1 Tax=Drosophila ananassae TaxID=7217 RepID=B3LW55_DROAN|nr:mucin-17 [Drosophila ananassae]EDV42633.1 uncharacterized protein Dana_GF16925 [Drosophila ananassae]
MAAAAAAPATSNGNTPALGTAPAAAAPAGGSGGVGGGSGAQFREIHKNTWLKRLTADGKRLTVGPKKSECSWVVFCVHDDTEALLEGYAEPRQAAGHLPEWAVSLRETLHISHALIPNSHEFEFVVTLSNEVLRFHAVSWEIMQEWVETLRSKLREMKILSPRENLYTKLPEVRAPLLPTRDPTSPLPPPPPVPAALVPGVERVVAPSQHPVQQPLPEQPSSPTPVANPLPVHTASTPALASTAPTSAPPPAPAAMSNTLTQHLLNMLSDPISTYSEQISEELEPSGAELDATIEGAAASDPQLTNDADLNLSDDEFLSPLLRKACVLTENGVRLDVVAATAQRVSADQILNLEHMLQCERLIPRPQTSRSMSAGAADKSKRPPRKPLPAQSTSQAASTAPAKSEEPQDNVTIIQVSNTSTVSQDQDQPPELPPKNTATAEVFRFPEVKSKVNGKQHLPQAHQEYKSNVQIIPSNVQSSSSTSTIQVGSSNSYTTPIKQSASNGSSSSTPANSSGTTKVKVLNEGEATTVAVYGTCYPSPSSSNSASNPIKPQTPKLSKKIILSANTSGITNISINSEQSSDAIISGNVHYEKVFLSSSIPISSSASPTRSTQPVSNGSPVLARRRLASPQTQVQPVPQNAPRRTPQLTRGLTELVISSRPSRRDFHYLKLLNSPLKTKTSQKSSSATNNNIEQQPASSSNSSQVTAVQRVTTSESQEQRRRSSSTSDAQAPLQRAPRESGNQRNANNNEFTPSRSNAFRMQPPPQGAPPSSSTPSSTNPAQQSPNKRLTLREQQVMQLRREIMHPGGVRLNLRRKDCVGSIAWLDAFGGVWIGGWKQKEHPVLYNALHIGDQLLTIAGVNISSAAEANKIIRNTNTLFVEVLLRRIPFGRAYAIRRDREGQCLGLIRDGNTATIVDVVPNSLAARHGLPPKTQSCDGNSLTFWMLTEINGRPLNLFFKDLEIRDRLNSVGRDISILVQPSDLITKLKKQLKSLRGYKDYLVQ